VTFLKTDCCILVQFFTDFFTKQNKKQATLGNLLQRKSLKNMPERKVRLDPESGVLPLDDLPLVWQSKTNRGMLPRIGTATILPI
jgi:hypothetical protein